MKIPQLARLLKDLINHGLESFGRYYSTYRAFVIENGDPEGLHRLKVVIPEVTGNATHEVWAYPIGVFSGISESGTPYGTQMLPQRGDLVWVSFERGNPEVPLWRLGYPGGNEKNFNAEMLDPNSYWFVSPKGNSVIINDTNNYITITLATGEAIKISPDALSLVHNKKVALGSLDGGAEKALLGESHNAQQKATLDSISKITVMTAMGPSSVPLNAADFINQQTALDGALSEKVTLD